MHYLQFANNKVEGVCVHPRREYGGPHWMFRQQFFDIVEDGTLVCAYSDVSHPGTTVAVFPPGGKVCGFCPMCRRLCGSLVVQFFP